MKRELAGSNPCSQIGHAPERRFYSCMLIGHTYQVNLWLVILGKCMEIDRCPHVTSKSAVRYGNYTVGGDRLKLRSMERVIEVSQKKFLSTHIHTHTHTHTGS